MKKEVRNNDFNFIGFFKSLAGVSENENEESEVDENTDNIRTVINQSDLSETDINYLLKGIEDIDKLASKTTAGKEEKKRKNGKRKETTNQKQHEEPNNIESIKLELENGDREDDRIA